MKNRKQKYLAFLLSAFVLSMGAGLSTACSSGGKEDSTGEKTEYEYQYNKAYADEPDVFVTLDGKLDEDIWKAQNAFVHVSDGVETRVSTVFTSKGLYIGAIAYDPYVYWASRNDFDNNSSFRFRVANPKEKQTTDDIDNNRDVHTFSHADFTIDYLTCRSFRQTRYNSAAYVDGEINLSGATKKNTTTSLSVEIFVTWEELHVDTSEYEYGIPDFVRIYSHYRKIDGVNQTKVNVNLCPMSAQINRLESWIQYNRDGVSVVYGSEYYGNADNGPAATDQWKITETAEQTLLESSVNRTQTIWFKTARKESFILSATIKPGEINDYNEVMERNEYENPHTGFLLYSDTTHYSLFVASCRELYKNHTLVLKSAGRTDGLQWLGQLRYNEKVFDKTYLKDSIDLRLVKCGSEIYYFYKETGADDWVFWNAETIGDVSGEVFAGLFTNGSAQFINPSYTDYTGRTNELLAEMKNYVYYVELPERVANGSISINKTVLKKGEFAQLDLLPNSGAVLTELTANGASLYNGVSGRYYTITPTADMADENNTVFIVPTFTKFSDGDLQKIQISFADAANVPQNVSFYIEDDKNLIYYRSTAVGQGKSNLMLPKGACTVNGREFEFTGIYTLVVESSNYIPAQLTIDLTDAGKITSGIYYDTLLVQKVGYGNVTVNGINTKNANGSLGYDFEKGCYYITGSNVANGSARAYYLDGVAENFAVDVKLENVAIGAGTKNVPGLLLSTGNNTMELKASPYDNTKNALYVNINDTEIALSGFGNSIDDGGGRMEFTAVRYDNVLFLYNADGTLLAALSAKGISLYNGCTVSATTEKYNAFVAKLAIFFANVNKENAIGVVTHWNKDFQGSSYFDITWNTSEDYIKSEFISALEVYDFEPQSDEDYTISVSGVKISQSYLVGMPLTIVIRYKDKITVASQIAVSYGGITEYVDGEYNAAAKSTTFVISGNKELTGVTVSKTAVIDYVSISGNLSSMLAEGATITLTGTTSYGKTVREDWTNKVGENGVYSVADVESGSYELTVIHGNDKRFKAFTAESDDLVINASDFVKDPVNLNLRQNDWSENKFQRLYNETDGVYYTVKNPAMTGSAAQYTYAPVTMDETNKFTLSYDVTVESGGPLDIGVTLGAHRSVLTNGTETIKPMIHLFLRLDGTTGKLDWAYHVTYGQNREVKATFFFDALNRPDPFNGFGDTFRLTIVRENSIIAFFVNGSLLFYWNDESEPLVAGYEISDTPMYYGISVRSNKKGTGTATFKNIACSNTADLSAYFTEVTGTHGSLTEGTQAMLTLNGTTNVNGFAFSQKITKYVYEAGKISFIVPYGTYSLDIRTTTATYSATFTAEAGTKDVVLSYKEKDLRDALIDSPYMNDSWQSCDVPADATTTYSADGSSVTLTDEDWGYYLFANTAGVTYTYEVQITGNTNWNAMPGVAIIGKNSSVVNFKFANWERFCVILDVTTKGTHSDDYVYSNASSSLTGSENADKLQFMQNPNVSAAFNVTLKFEKTETNLIVYVKGATSDYVKLVEIKADGSITLNEEYFAVKTDNGIDETETGYVKNLFGAGVETCLGISTTTVGTNVTYTVKK